MKRLNDYLSKLKGWPLFFIFLGAVLRSWGFWKALFGSDEALHMTRAVSVSRGLVDLFKLNNPSIALRNIFLPILQHNHPPFEFLLAIPGVPFQPREFSARLVFVLISIVFLPFVFLILEKIKNRKYALIFLILFSTSMYAVWWSRTITHDLLAIILGTFLGISIIYFYKKPDNRSLKYIFITQVLSLYIILDFAVYIPILALVVYRNRRKINSKKLLTYLFFSILALAVYHVPYILYSLLPTSSHSAGFNYYIYGKLGKDISVSSFMTNITNQINSFYVNFFRQSGVFPAWIFALLSLKLINKKTYLPIFFKIVAIYFLINMVFPTTLFFYKDFYGLILLLATEWLFVQKRFLNLILICVIAINLSGSLPIFKGVHNDIFNVYRYPDDLNKIGLYAKNCLTGNDSYISTISYWRTEYYFGRQPLPRINQGFSIHDVINNFIAGDLRNDIYLIHFREGDLNDEIVNQLRKISTKEVVINKDHAFLFKECTFSL